MSNDYDKENPPKVCLSTTLYHHLHMYEAIKNPLKKVWPRYGVVPHMIPQSLYIPSLI